MVQPTISPNYLQRTILVSDKVDRLKQWATGKQFWMTLISAETREPIVRYLIKDWQEAPGQIDRWSEQKQLWIPILVEATTREVSDVLAAYQEATDWSWFAMRPLIRDLGHPV